MMLYVLMITFNIYNDSIIILMNIIYSIYGYNKRFNSIKMIYIVLI